MGLLDSNEEHCLSPFTVTASHTPESPWEEALIRIVTDSSCDLPDEVIDRHRITVVPLTIRFGDDDLVDREELSVDEFWDRLTHGDVTPETAAPSVGRFQDAFQALSDEGADGIVAILISSEISATHQSAVLAADQFTSGVPVSVVDSRLVSGALGMAVIAAAERAEAGGTLDEVEAAALAAADSINFFAALDTLEYLKRGGRIGGAAAFFGNLLDVKPIITFEDGAVHPGGRVRTRKKSLTAVLTHLDEVDAVEVGVLHADPEELDGFVASLEERGIENPTMYRLGPVVGTHSGPGVLGVVYRKA
jgi:DegV family protein with EDD domain